MSSVYHLLLLPDPIMCTNDLFSTGCTASVKAAAVTALISAVIEMMVFCEDDERHGLGWLCSTCGIPKEKSL